MSLNASPVYSLLLLIAAILSFGIMLTAWRRRHQDPCASFVALFSFGTFLWSLTYAIHWTPIPRPSPFFWVDVTYFGVVIVPTAFFAFTLCYTDRSSWLNRRTLPLLAMEPLLTLFFLWTDATFGLFFAGKRQAADAVIYDGSLWFWFHVVYSYSLILAGVTLLGRAFFSSPRAYRGQIGMLLLGALIPFVVNAFALLVYNPTPNLDLTPITFSLTGVLLAIGILRFRFLDIRPIALRLLFMNLRDAVIVVDERKRVIEANPAAHQLFEPQLPSLLGRTIDEIKALLLGFPEHLWERVEVQAECSLPGPPLRYYEVSITPLVDRKNVYRGRLFTLREITARKEVELQLRAAKDQLEEHVEKIEKLQARLREESIRDALTGLFNRRFFQESLQREIARSKRFNQPISLVLIDLDHFKRVNDTWGHAAGDQVLVHLSNMLTEMVRKGDIVCRYGGEEFIVLLPGAPPHKAALRANQWREAFSRSGVPYERNILLVTFSAGVASFPADGEQVEQVLEAADRRLYRAKVAGRNRVCDSLCEANAA